MVIQQGAAHLPTYNPLPTSPTDTPEEHGKLSTSSEPEPETPVKPERAYDRDPSADSAQPLGPETDGAAAAAAAGRMPTRSSRASRSRRREPTTELSLAQKLYVFGIHGVGSFLVSGGINFGIACAMYLDPSGPVTLFRLPNTLAGDAALTIIIQPVVTWFIESILVRTDIRAGRIAPFAPPPGSIFGPPSTASTTLPTSESSPPTSTSRRLPSLTTLCQRFFTVHPPTPRVPPIYPQLLRLIAIIIPSFLLLWGPSIGILTALGTKEDGGEGRDYVFESRWTPQVFKLVLGGVLGLLVTPIMALFWMVREGGATGRVREKERERERRRPEDVRRFEDALV